MIRVLVSLIWTVVSGDAIIKEIPQHLKNSSHWSITRCTVRSITETPLTLSLRHVLPDHEEMREGSSVMIKWQPNIITTRWVPWRGKDWWGRSYQEGFLEEVGTWGKPPRAELESVKLREQWSKVLRARWATQKERRGDSMSGVVRNKKKKDESK